LGTFQLFKTSTAGRTWRHGVVLHGEQSSQACGESLYFANRRDGWIFGDVLWGTRDGGRTWHKELDNVDTIVAHGNRAWALVSPCGFDQICQERLYESSIGTATWHEAPPLPPAMFTLESELLPVTNTTLFLLSANANNGPKSGLLWRTTDSGRSWKRLRSCSYDGLAAALDSENLWLACSEEPSTTEATTFVYGSRDAGRHWTLLASNPYASEHERKVGHLPVGFVEQIVPLSSDTMVMSYGKFGAIYR
jgi:photosystem II stability/assembly factor-like uncharacterized protein